MDHAQALAYLAEREQFGIKLGLENIATLCGALDHPEATFRSVLVAGTNGKGSTTALLESILRASGLRTGRYTSPHLVRLEERICISGESISETELASVVSELAGRIVALRSGGALLTEPTFFEVVTACGFELFRRRGVEVAVLEVGLGGRFDATNVAPAELTVITNIAFDHERYLGRTLAHIAAEKAGTIKPGRFVVTAVEPGEAQEAIRAEAERLSAPLIFALEEVEYQARELEGGQRVSLRTPDSDYPDVFLPLAGEHQLQNLAVAVRAAEVGFHVPRDAVVSGIAATVWPARLERVPGAPPLLMDVAHNPHGAEALARYLTAHPRTNRVLLFAVMHDKNVEAMTELLFRCAARIVVTRPLLRRAADPELVARQARARGFPTEAVEPVEKALSRAREIAGPSGEVVVAGSIFLAGEVKRLLLREG